MKRVFLVEHEQDQQRKFKNILEETKFKLVATASNGEEALDTYESVKPAITVMGLDLPGSKTSEEGGGIKAIENFSEKYPKARIIISYKISNKFLLMKALKESGTGEVKKPFTKDGVLEALVTAQKAESGEQAVKRKSVRVKKKFPLRLSRKNQSWLQSLFSSSQDSLFTSDISPSGLSFQYDGELKENEKLELEIDLPCFDTPLKTDAAVVRCNPSVGLDLQEVAVTFLNLDEDTVETLRSYLLSVEAKD